MDRTIRILINNSYIILCFIDDFSPILAADRNNLAFGVTSVQGTL